jgi:hypothetical protein
MVITYAQQNNIIVASFQPSVCMCVCMYTNNISKPFHVYSSDTYIHTYIRMCTKTYKTALIHTYIHTNVRKHTNSHLSYIHTYINTCIHTCIQTVTYPIYIHTYIHAYMHTNSHLSYIHTYIHTYIHAYKQSPIPRQSVLFYNTVGPSKYIHTYIHKTV